MRLSSSTEKAVMKEKTTDVGRGSPGYRPEDVVAYSYFIRAPCLKSRLGRHQLYGNPVREQRN